MIYHGSQSHRNLLKDIARRVMVEKGLLPDFPPEVDSQLANLQNVGTPTPSGIRDLRSLIWCSIDNDSSKDLDQLTTAVLQPQGELKLLIAVADVDAVVKTGSAIDNYARHNTTSVYTAAETFPMLPPQLSTDLTSLNAEQDRQAIVIELVLTPEGKVKSSDIYLALVRNKVKLAYNQLAAWLEGTAQAPEKVRKIQGLADNLKLQDKAAQLLKNIRHEHGALTLETREVTPLFKGDLLVDLQQEEPNRAKELIEDLMIAANVTCALFLEVRKFPSLRRVVHKPWRWERIVEIAATHNVALPPEPDSPALEQFLLQQKTADPEHFPDLSLSIIKLLGAGEYTVELPGEQAEGHFGLAVKDYTHSTAPNRRYPDIITHRLLKAAIAGQACPYAILELQALAQHCNEAEDAARKVERQVGKSAAALLLQSKLGHDFWGYITGAAEKGTWVRILHPPVEGRIISDATGLDIGLYVHVRLENADVEQGRIDFSVIR